MRLLNGKRLILLLLIGAFFLYRYSNDTFNLLKRSLFDKFSPLSGGPTNKELLEDELLEREIIEDKRIEDDLMEDELVEKELATQIDWDDPTAKVSKYFTVNDVFFDGKKFDPARREALFKLPETEREKIIKNIFNIAAQLDELTKQYGKLTIMSWYRDKATNKRVGGASKSSHILGYAVDIRPTKDNGKNNFGQRMEDELDTNWQGGLGYGWKEHGFIHLDLREGAARWNY
jgi:uncharacterized protein YcbK (DUF882 family)